jgi:hypothetical protein
MARKEDYPWGKERPRARTRRLRRLADQTDLEIQAARAAYEKAVAGIRARKASVLQECERIDRCLNARGEYDPILAKAVAPGSWNSIEIPAKRPRGRPRTRFPGDPPPPRKSRAKAGGRRGRRSSAHIPTPVPTAGEQIPTLPTRQPLPQAAAVFVPKSAGLPANDNRLPQPEPALPKKVAPKFATYQGPDKALAYEEAQRKQKAALKIAVAKYEREADEIAIANEIREAFRMPYDFSDPCDPSKVPGEVLALFPRFGFAHKIQLTNKLADLPSEHMIEWIKQADHYNKEEYSYNYSTVDRIKGYIERLGLQKYIDTKCKHTIFEFTAEKYRREAWHWVNLRIQHVELARASLQRGGVLEAILDQVARFDYMAEESLTDHSIVKDDSVPCRRNIFVKILDALQWPEGFSRRDLIRRALPDHDPKVPLGYSPFDGPAKNIPTWRQSAW